jgi:hypothetical protein
VPDQAFKQRSAAELSRISPGYFGFFLFSVVSSCTSAAGLASTEQQGPISDHIVGLPTYTLNGVNTHLGLWPPRFPTSTFPVCIIRSTGMVMGGTGGAPISA